jgi:ribosome-binding protein aMBF1 (putative translation factor)
VESQQQYELLMVPKPNPAAQQAVSDETIFLQKTKLDAIDLARRVAGLSEKEVYMAMQIDKATWSKIMSGQFNWPTDGDEKFEAIVGNNILTRWQMYKRGYKQPERRLDAIEELIAARDTRIAELERDINLMRDLLTKR